MKSPWLWQWTICNFGSCSIKDHQCKYWWSLILMIVGSMYRATKSFCIYNLRYRLVTIIATAQDLSGFMYLPVVILHVLVLILTESIKLCYLDLQKLQYPPLPDGFWENPDGLFKFKSLLARFLTSPCLCSQTCRRCDGGGDAAVTTRSCTSTTSGSSWWWWRRRSAPGHRAVATSAPGRSGTRCWRGSRTLSSRASGLPFTWVRRTSLPASLWMIVRGAWS